MAAVRRDRALFPQGPVRYIVACETIPGFRGPMEDHMAVATAKKTTDGKPDAKHNLEAMREAYYERIAKYDMAPLWKVMKSVVTKEPVTHVAPAMWRFADVKALVLGAGR